MLNVILVILVLCGLLVMCSDRDGKNHKTDEAFDEKWRQLTWIDRGKDAVKLKLKDPESAQFRNVFYHLGHLQGKEIPLTCGEVNSRTVLGGYGGFQRFVSGGNPEVTWLEEQVVGFDDVWAQLCM